MQDHQVKQNDFLLGISRATNALISKKLEEGINLAIEALGKHLNVYATCVYVNKEAPSGEVTCSIRYAWSMKRVQERVDNNQGIALHQLGPLFERLKSGDYFEMHYSQSEGLLHEHMTADGTQSIVLFPIMVGEEFWGSVALVEFRFERPWEESEKQMLQTLANSFGAAIGRHRLEENLEAEVAKRTQELERSRLRFKLAVEGSQDGIWEWLPQTGENYWSPRMYAQLGYAAEELPSVGEEFFEMVHPEERKEAKSRFIAHLKERAPYKVEFRLKTKSAGYRWFRSTGQAQWDDEGKAIRMVGSHEDIHEKKEQEEQLKRSEERFRAVIKYDPNATFLVNSKGAIELFSDRACQVFKYEACDFAKLQIHDLLPEAARGRHEGHFKEFMKQPETRRMGQGMDLKALRSGGEEFWVEVGLSPVTIRGEVFVMAVVTDISKRREAEMALEESHRRIGNLIDNLPGMAYRCINATDWPMEYISAACLDITGYPPHNFVGESKVITFGDIIHPDDQDDLWEQVQESLATRKPYRVVYRIKDRRGREKWLWEQGSGVFDGEDVLALEGCIFDITPVVRNQERVNGAIYHAEDQERRRIAGEIHDGLQQTLSVSALNLQYLENEVKQLSGECQDRFNKSREFLEQGIRESRQIAHRLMPKAIHDVGLDRALQELVKEVQNVSGLNCTYYCNLDGRLSEKLEVGLYRTAQEALNNILKYAHAHKVTLQLVGFEQEIQLMIEDNGIGFDKNKLDLYKGGFGLTGMKNRINSLSGSLHIDTKSGHGTSIVARIPIQQ